VDDDNFPKRPGPVTLVLSALVTLYLLWAIFGATEQPSSTLRAMQWILLIGNLGFLGFYLIARKK
jgi:hypothetical protein